MKPGVILLVDNDVDDVFIVNLAFEQWGLKNPLQVLWNGAQVVDYLTGQGGYANREQFPLPSLILLDLHLPKLSGLEVVTWIRARPEWAKLPVVILSGSGNSKEVACALDLGANAALKKTPTRENLLEQFVELNETVLGPKFP